MAKTSPIIGARVMRVKAADNFSRRGDHGADVHFPDELWDKILCSPISKQRNKKEG